MTLMTILLIIAAVVILVLSLDKAFGFLPKNVKKLLNSVHTIVKDGKITIDEIIEEIKKW